MKISALTDRLDQASVDRDEERWQEVRDYEAQAKAAAESAEDAGRIRVRAVTRDILASDRIPEPEKLTAVREAWIRTLSAAQADDTWSGRTNDARRSYADGVRQEIDRLTWTW